MMEASLDSVQLTIDEVKSNDLALPGRNRNSDAYDQQSHFLRKADPKSEAVLEWRG